MGSAFASSAFASASSSSSNSSSNSSSSSNCSFSNSSRFRLHHHAHPADACAFNRILQILVECWQRRRRRRSGSGTRLKIFARHLFPCTFQYFIRRWTSGGLHLPLILYFSFFFLCFHCNNPMIRNKKKKNVTWLCSPLQHPKQEQQIITEDKIRRQKEKKTVRKKRERKKFSFRIRQFFYMI